LTANAPKGSGAGCSAGKLSGTPTYDSLTVTPYNDNSQDTRDEQRRAERYEERRPAGARHLPGWRRVEKGIGPDDYGFGIVGLVGVAARAQGVVVVVEQEQPPVSEREDALEGLEGERERVTEPDVALAFGRRDRTGVPDREQVQHLPFDQEPFGVGVAQVHDLLLFEARLLALLVIALYHQEAPVVERRQVPYGVFGCLRAVPPPLARVAPATQVELVEKALALVLIVFQSSFEHRVKGTAVRGDRHPLIRTTSGSFATCSPF
jgi:hypothetical protein